MTHIRAVGRSGARRDAVASCKRRDAGHGPDMGHPSGRPERAAGRRRRPLAMRQHRSANGS